MEKQNEGTNEKAFKNFGRRVDAFMAELNEASEKLQQEFQGRYEELKEAAERMKKEAENRERWKEVENSLKRAGEELQKAFKTAFKK